MGNQDHLDFLGAQVVKEIKVVLGRKGHKVYKDLEVQSLIHMIHEMCIYIYELFCFER